MASKEDQIAVAERILAAQGPGAWAGGANFVPVTPALPGFAEGGGVVDSIMAGVQAARGTDTVPAMLTPGEHVLTTGDVAAMGGQRGVYDFRAALHGGAPPGTGGPAPVGGTGVSRVGGVAPPAGQGSGFGITGGGLIGLAQSAAITAAEAGISAAMAAAAAQHGGEILKFWSGGQVPGGSVQHMGTGAPPGPVLGTGSSSGSNPAGGAGGSLAAAAANIGIQEINRFIGYLGQVAGIGVSGLMETFLPTGASELATNNWATRLLGGIVGARPALPNLAGGKGQEPALGPGPTAGIMQPGMTGAQLGINTATAKTGARLGDTQINVQYQNIGATEDRAAKDLTHHLSQGYKAAGAR